MRKGPNVKKELLRAAVALTWLAAGTPVGAAQVTVSDAWFRALPASLPAGGYFTLHNNGTAVQLTAAQSPACGTLMLHRSTRTGGMDSMMMVGSVIVPAGGTIAFSPGGYHLMCTSPKSAMTPGGQVPVTFRFSDGTTTTARFDVRNASGR